MYDHISSVVKERMGAASRRRETRLSNTTVCDALRFTESFFPDVHPVLDDVEVEGGQIDRAEILDAVVDRVEGVRLVGAPHPLDRAPGALKAATCR